MTTPDTHGSAERGSAPATAASRLHFEDTLDRMWRSLRTTDRYWTPNGGWYHSTRSVAAHCWDHGYPLCQDSDPGKAIWHGRHDHAVGRICEDCRVVLQSRLRQRMRLVNAHRRVS